MGIDEALCQIEACGYSTGDVDSRSEEASVFRLGIDQGVKAARASLAIERERSAALRLALSVLRRRLRIGSWSAVNAGRPSELLAQIGEEIDAILEAR
jgi:hypothetical protein